MTKDIYVTNHKLILFSVVLSIAPASQNAPICRRVFNPMSAVKFAEIFISVSSAAFNPNFNTDELVSLFNYNCRSILDCVAPFKLKHSSSTLLPWLNETTQEFKRDCRKKERKWKKSSLHVFYEIWKDAMKKYQSAVKEARAAFFSKLILANHSNPRYLFNTINSLIVLSSHHFIDPSQETCETFLQFFTDKVNDIRQPITLADVLLSSTQHIFSYFNNFKMLS